MKDWRRKPDVDKTWVNLKTFLAEEYNDYLEDEVAEENNPFRASNVMYDDTMEALQNLMMNMTTYQDNLTSLSEANALLTSSNSTLETSVKTLQNQMLALQREVKALTNKFSNPDRSGSSSTPTPPANRKKYCYTCGVQTHHFSNGCPIAPSGHKKNATWKNRMGGSNVDHTE